VNQRDFDSKKEVIKREILRIDWFQGGLCINRLLFHFFERIRSDVGFYENLMYVPFFFSQYLQAIPQFTPPLVTSTGCNSSAPLNSCCIRSGAVDLRDKQVWPPVLDASLSVSKTGGAGRRRE
jgi:hypothetical protein